MSQVARHHDQTVTFGFWVYLMTDCVLFAALFATFLVLRSITTSPTGSDLFSLPNVLAETLILLTSSFTCGLAMLAAQRQRLKQVITWLSVTFMLGATFLALEVNEFHHLVQAGHSWTTNGFLSTFFTLVGTHGLHITIGLLWMFVLIAQLGRHGFRPSSMRKLTLLSLFWHFLDIVWIFIFTVVYLMGSVKR